MLAYSSCPAWLSKTFLWLSMDTYSPGDFEEKKRGVGMVAHLPFLKDPQVGLLGIQRITVLGSHAGEQSWSRHGAKNPRHLTFLRPWLRVQYLLDCGCSGGLGTSCLTLGHIGPQAGGSGLDGPSCFRTLSQLGVLSSSCHPILFCPSLSSHDGGSRDSPSGHPAASFPAPCLCYLRVCQGCTYGS